MLRNLGFLNENMISVCCTHFLDNSEGFHRLYLFGSWTLSIARVNSCQFSYLGGALSISDDQSWSEMNGARFALAVMSSNRLRHHATNDSQENSSLRKATSIHRILEKAAAKLAVISP